jgi:hypothetical protein
MWIHARKDPTIQWLHMCYYIIEGEIDMVINKWLDEWRIPSINREVTKITAEEEAKHGATQPPKIQVPKRLRMGQGKPTQTYKGPKKIGT